MEDLSVPYVYQNKTKRKFYSKANFFIFFFLFIFTINLVSAVEWDNYYTYDPVTRTATFKNGLTFGSEIAKVRLNSPLNAKVPIGYNPVFEVEIWGNVDYDNFVKSISLHNKSQSFTNIDRPLDLKYFDGYETYYDNVYGCYDTYTSSNGSIICNFSTKPIKKTRQRWVNLTPDNLLKNDHLIIRGFTTVQPNDNIEWFIDFFGAGKDTGYGSKGVKEWASWTSDLNTSLRGYFSFNETSGSAIDDTKQVNGTVFGTSRGSTGWFDRTYNYSYDPSNSVTATDYVQLNTENYMRCTSGSCSASFWFKFNLSTTATSDGFLISKNNHYQDGNANGWDLLYIKSSGKLRLTVTDSNNEYFVLTNTTNLTDGNWHHIVAVWGTNGQKVWVDGVLEADAPSNTQVSGLGSTLTPVTFGARYRNTFTEYRSGLNGKIDEIALWDRALNDSEALSLWNSGFGLKLNQGETLPTIIFNSPPEQNYTSTSPVNVTFNFSVNDTFGISDVKLYINGFVQEINASGQNNTDYLFNVTLNEGTYIVYGSATNVNNVTSKTENRTYIIDTSNPIINITSPPSIFGSLENGQLLNLTYNITDATANLCYYSYNTPFTLNSGNFTTSVSLSAGSKAYYFENNSIDSSSGDITFLYNFGSPNYHTLSKSALISRANWTSALSTPDCYGQTYNSPDVSFNSNLGKYVCVDLPSGEKTIMQIKGNSNFNWTYYGRPLDCSGENTNFVYQEGVNNLTIYARDIFNRVSNKTRSWITIFNEVNNTYNSSLYVSELNNLRIDIFHNSLTVLNPKFIYDGVEYSATLNTINSTYFYLESSISSYSNLTGNNTFYWNITLDGTEYSTIQRTQEIKDINFSICDGSNNVTFLTLFFADEETNSPLNAKIRTSSWDYYISDPNAKQNYTYGVFTNSSSYSFCFTPSIRELFINSSVSYSANTYPERTNGINQKLTNSSTNLTLTLLSENSGIYSTLVFIDSITKVGIDSVNVKIYDGTNLIIDKNTDSSGTISEFLNPNILYTVIATKTGYNDNTRTIRPSIEAQNIEMESTGITTQEGILNGLSYEFYPSSYILDKNTNYSFGFYVKEGAESISYVNYSIYDDNNTLIGFSEKSNDGNLSQTLINTYNNLTFKGIYVIKGSDGGYAYFSRVYIIGSFNEGNYSFSQWGLSFDTYFPSGQRTNLTLLIWFILWFVLMLMAFSFGYNGSFKTQSDITKNTSPSTRGNTSTGLVFAFLVTLLFSYFNLIPVPFIPSSNNFFGEFARQNFMASIILFVLIWDLFGSSLIKYFRSNI